MDLALAPVARAPPPVALAFDLELVSRFWVASVCVGVCYLFAFGLLALAFGWRSASALRSDFELKRFSPRTHDFALSLHVHP